MIRFDNRRRQLRAALQARRVGDRDASTERLMADAFVLDELLVSEFVSLPRESNWCFNTGGGKEVAAILAVRFKARGTYDGLGKSVSEVSQ